MGHNMRTVKKVYTLIPARSGSKRVKDKNIRLLNGKPLLAWSIVASLGCNLPTWVSTDSEEYADIAREWGSEVVMRPAELALDGVGDRPVIAHFLDLHPCDAVVYLRPTTPFRVSSVIEDAVNTLDCASGNATGLRSVEETGESMYKGFTMRPGPYLEPIRYFGQDMTDLPNQECPKTYKPNGYVDICKSETISAGGLWGDKVIGYVTPRACEIDAAEDWEWAEYLANKERRFDFGTTEN